MPEEVGPEPQELFEQAEHHKHEADHGGHGGHVSANAEEHSKKQFTMRAAITASVLAVLAALASLLSGHAANEAILKQTEASDKWAYFQAKSTKSHIFEGNKYVVRAFAEMQGKLDAPSVKTAIEEFEKKVKDYDKDKEKIKEEAEQIEHASTVEFSKHHNLALAVACFQIGIVLASVSILVHSRYLYTGSILAGVVGVAFVAMGLM